MHSNSQLYSQKIFVEVALVKNDAIGYCIGLTVIFLVEERAVYSVPDGSFKYKVNANVFIVPLVFKTESPRESLS